MAGYDLKEGYFLKEFVSEDELWSSLTSVFSSKSKNTTSYKFGFLKSILDNLYNVDTNLSISFDQLFSTFAEINWNLILKYRLKQSAPVNDGRITELEQILQEAIKHFSIIEIIPYESLTLDMKEYISLRVKNKCKKYVIGALYEDTQKRFYSFSRKYEWLQINPQMYDFICKHKLIIEKLNYFEWAKFLEKNNEPAQTTQLLNKIDNSSKRNDLSYYRQILFEQFEDNNCFYCGKKIRQSHSDVDHFIPWSFIKDDNLWNLVLACPKCNRKKQDRLPSMEFLERLYTRNILLISNHSFTEMKNYDESKIKNIYHWAIINGYKNNWKPY